MSASAFLSKENILMHKGFLKNSKLLYSVFEKSYPRLKGLSAAEINRLNISANLKKEAIEKKTNIEVHELFFNSFSEKRVRCPEICASYGSEANFLYEIEKSANEIEDSAFIVIYVTSNKEPAFYCGKRFSNLFIKAYPCLAVDLWEHAYFTDYGFDRKKYIRSALSYLDFSKITDFIKKD